VAGDAGGNSQSFSYDDLNRVTGSSGLAAGATTYAYDRSGNRTSATVAGTTTTYAYDRTDELTSQTISGGPTTAFAYDTQGNQTAKAEPAGGVTSFGYDTANRLVRAAPSSGSAATYGLDALGRTQTRTIGATTETYGFVGTSETVVTISAGSAVTTALVGDASDRLALASGTSLAYLLFDLHGDLAGQIGTAGAVVSASRYRPYGDLAAGPTAGGIPSPWAYRGALDLSPSADPLYDIGARLYAPSEGAWTQLDSVAGSVADPLSLNRFLYALANPATLIDPDGHAACAGWDDDCRQLHDRQVENEQQRKAPTSGGNSTSAPASSKPPASSTSSGARPPTGKDLLPSWLWAEYRDYLRSPDYLYRDRLTADFDPDADTGELVGRFLSWYGLLVSSIGMPVQTGIGMAASGACGDNAVCGIAAAVLIPGLASKAARGLASFAGRTGAIIRGAGLPSWPSRLTPTPVGPGTGIGPGRRRSARMRRQGSSGLDGA
jgi:RHS repeat-associated protein